MDAFDPAPQLTLPALSTALPTRGRSYNELPHRSKAWLAPPESPLTAEIRKVRVVCRWVDACALGWLSHR